MVQEICHIAGVVEFISIAINIHIFYIVLYVERCQLIVEAVQSQQLGVVRQVEARQTVITTIQIGQLSEVLDTREVADGSARYIQLLYLGNLLFSEIAVLAVALGQQEVAEVRVGERR